MKKSAEKGGIFPSLFLLSIPSLTSSSLQTGCCEARERQREREIRQIDLESKGPRVERGEGSRIGGGAVPCGRRWFLRGEEENFKRKKNVVGFSMGMSYSPSQDRTNTIRLALNDEKGRGEGSLDTGYVHT